MGVGADRLGPTVWSVVDLRQRLRPNLWFIGSPPTVSKKSASQPSYNRFGRSEAQVEPACKPLQMRSRRTNTPLRQQHGQAKPKSLRNKQVNMSAPQKAPCALRKNSSNGLMPRPIRPKQTQPKLRAMLTRRKVTRLMRGNRRARLPRLLPLLEPLRWPALSSPLYSPRSILLGHRRSHTDP